MAQASRLTTIKKILIVLCAIIPPLGAFGIHDFIVGNGKQGMKHIVMMVLGLFATPLIMTIMMCDSGCSESEGAIINLLACLGMVFLFFPMISYILAIVECIQILIKKMIIIC